MESNLYAVYGSLREGWWNHSLLEDAELVTTTTVPGYKLMSNGCFPAAIESPGEGSVVEVYDVTNVDTRTVDAMDGMEFNCGYIRRLVETTEGYRVWLYVMPDERAARFSEEVDGNDWNNTQEVF